ncbi:hypothetical protein [Nitrospira moscoviensis]|uniref:Uncharacterized protein n=1 Tax=Nitrospira moscoviensis TaxID=42253 RepID=A0A0K2GBY2_NITMO|nr:hypothetical protein [Nitrospira moscoviensis]ALA58461.1 hypothetical protein NITMOv2_2044 [Nitrospira moscoviensis]
MAATLSDIANHLQDDLVQFQEEVRVVNATIVRPSWQVSSHHFPVTLWGYVMAGFARLDLYSQLWDGNVTKKQTARMRAFLRRFLPRDPTADAVAIQLWRHTLMHTSRPRRLRDRVTGREYSYLLHWGIPELPAHQHYQIVDGNKLDFGLEHFLNDLQNLLSAYLFALRESPDLQAKATATWQTIVTQEFGA